MSTHWPPAATTASAFLNGLALFRLTASPLAVKFSNLFALNNGKSQMIPRVWWKWLIQYSRAFSLGGVSDRLLPLILNSCVCAVVIKVTPWVGHFWNCQIHSWMISSSLSNNFYWIASCSVFTHISRLEYWARFISSNTPCIDWKMFCILLRKSNFPGVTSFFSFQANVGSISSSSSSSSKSSKS